LDLQLGSQAQLPDQTAKPPLVGFFTFFAERERLTLLQKWWLITTNG
jgi:hypothetical protein